MEYLMTYGWAILIVIIVVAVLFSLGVFDPSTFTQTTVTGLSGFNVPAGGWQLTAAGVLQVQISNAGGSSINITDSGASVGSTSANNNVVSGFAGQTLAPGETMTLSFSNLGPRTSGTSYTAKVNVTFDNTDTGIPGFKSSGTLTGSVS